MSGGGFGAIKKTVINTCVHKPVPVYLGVGAFLYAYRWYQTKV